MRAEDSTGDGWEPLPSDDHCARPGERCEIAKKAPPPAPLPAPPAPPPDPAAAQALAALQQKLAAAAPATSLVATVQHREQRVERQRRAGTNPELSGTLARIADDPTARPVVEYDPGVQGRDAREESEWFAGLPAEERERLHDAWAGRRVRDVGVAANQKRIGNRRFAAALLAFAAAAAAGTHVYWHATLGAGILCGLWWRRRAPDRFLDPIRAMACLLVTQSIAIVVNGSGNPMLFMDAVIVIAVATIVGFDGEIRRSGGFDAK